MRTCTRLRFLVFIMVFTLGVVATVQATAQPKKFLAHYMPWYASRPISGQWGWHWTMNHYNPDKVDANGRRDIASHYYPLIGPYDSNDPDALECQVLLMKLAGVDGLIIDWYGIEDFYDYAALNRNTQHVIQSAKKAGLEFAICYEDQSIKHMVEGGHLAEKDAVRHGQDVMRWMQKQWFTDPTYLKVDGRPALFVFGPQYFKGNQWSTLFSVLRQKPFFYTLNEPRDGADGAFGWPPMQRYGGRPSPRQWHEYLRDLYASDKTGTTRVGAAFPGFHDIYQEAGIHKSYGFLDDRGGRTFEETLDVGLKSNSQLIQLVTWNDYGEGTVIEPTMEFGYRYLETIQNRLRSKAGRSSKYRAQDLRLPVEIYKLRKEHLKDNAVMADLDKASECLFVDDLAGARRLVERLQSTKPKD